MTRTAYSRQYGLWPVMGKMRACGDAGQSSGPKCGGGCCVHLREGGAGSPSNTIPQCRLGEAYHLVVLGTKGISPVPSPSSRLATTDMGRKVGSHISNRHKFSRGHSPQMVRAIGSGHCGQKIIRWKEGPTSRKFCAIG